MSSREDFPGSDEWYTSRGLQKPIREKDQSKKPEHITTHTVDDTRQILTRFSGLVTELSKELNMTERTIYHLIKINL